MDPPSNDRTLKPGAPKAKRARWHNTGGSTDGQSGTSAVFTVKSKKTKGKATQKRHVFTFDETKPPIREPPVQNKNEAGDLEIGSSSDCVGPSQAENSKGKSTRKRKRNFQNRVKILEWLPLRQTFLEEFLRHDGHGDYLGSEGCSSCSSTGCPLFKCRDCSDGAHLACRDCVLASHASLPLHRIEVWVDTHFEKTSLHALGLRYQLGHGGAPCPCPTPAPVNFQVFDISGVHQVNLDYCNCRQGAVAIDKTVQLLRSSLFPATLSRPQTAFTFDMLDLLHQLNLRAKTTVYDFYSMIVRRSDSLELNAIPSRCNDLHRTFRFYRVLMMMKRAGRGNDPTGVDGTKPGELVVACPACPHPDKNLPLNWKQAGALLYLYTLFLAVDANFKLKGKDRGISDVEITPGLGTFVEETQYQAHLSAHVDEPEINTCLSEHDAIVRAAVRRTPGYSVTGAGLVICACHGLVWPNGAGDLQKGEKYANMDYIILSALAGVALLGLCITYDIACQWSKNLKIRMEKLREHLQIDTTKTTITTGVPSWHINAHGPQCQTDHALLYKPGTCKTCGEEIETTWAETNILGASVREMGSGGRHETLNDHWNGMNHRKKIGLRLLLKRKLIDARKMVAQHQDAFDQLSETFSEVQKAKWLAQVKRWEEDPTTPNPYAEVKIEATLQDVRLRLSEEDAEEAARGIVAAHKTSMTSFLVTGLDLEDQQEALSHHAKTNKAKTSKQKAELEEKRTGLRRRVSQFREVQLAYTPCVATLLPLLVNQGDTVDPTVAEKIPLHLPSSLPPSLRSSIPQLVDKERRLREAQCDDALSTIRRQRRILTGLVQFKKLNLSGQGNKPNTRARSLYTRIQAKIARAHARYQRAHTALCTLDPDGAWTQRLKVLSTEDIRGPGREGDESNTRHVMSWIWLIPRAAIEGTDALGGDELDESLRVEWMKSRARLERWKEELELVQEEMRRTIVYLPVDADWWKKMARVEWSRSSAISHGASAYASKQSALCLALSRRFATVWAPVLESHGLTPRWPLDADPLLQNSSAVGGPGGEGEIEEEDEEEDDDNMADAWISDGEDLDGEYSDDEDVDNGLGDYELDDL